MNSRGTDRLLAHYSLTILQENKLDSADRVYEWRKQL